jgi:hypothetical protein
MECNASRVEMLIGSKNEFLYTFKVSRHLLV